MDIFLNESIQRQQKTYIPTANLRITIFCILVEKYTLPVNNLITVKRSCLSRCVQHGGVSLAETQNELNFQDDMKCLSGIFVN